MISVRFLPPFDSLPARQLGYAAIRGAIRQKAEICGNLWQFAVIYGEWRARRNAAR